MSGINQKTVMNLAERLKATGLSIDEDLLRYGEVRVLVDGYRNGGSFLSAFQDSKGFWRFADSKSASWPTSKIPTKSTDDELIYQWAFEMLSSYPAVCSMMTNLTATFKPRKVYPADEQQELCL